METSTPSSLDQPAKQSRRRSRFPEPRRGRLTDTKGSAGVPRRVGRYAGLSQTHAAARALSASRWSQLLSVNAGLSAPWRNLRIMTDQDLFLTSLLDTLSREVNTVLNNSPIEVKVEHDDFNTADIPSSSSDTWVKLPEVVAVVCDLKGSTHLGTGKHDTSTARIYKSGVEGAVRVLHEFEANFIDIQGDGGFGLFWGERAYERALCAAVTIRTFSEDFVERLEKRWPEGLPETGYKVGIHAARTLVKRIGTRRVISEQEAVWAGRPVNYAAKCAQTADRHQIIVTQAVWDRMKDNDYIAFSCDCGDGPTAKLWTDVTVDRLPEDDQDAVVLNAPWCKTCGPSFCEAIMAGEKEREIPESVRNAISRMKMQQALEAKRLRDRSRKNALAGLR